LVQNEVGFSIDGNRFAGPSGSTKADARNGKALENLPWTSIDRLVRPQITLLFQDQHGRDDHQQHGAVFTVNRMNVEEL
jgi:hypothetical protein